MATGAERVQHSAAELSSEGGVDEKVVGTVEDLQHCTDLYHIEPITLTDREGVAPDDLHDSRGRLTDDEGQDYNDHDQRDIVVRLLPQVHLGSLRLECPVRHYQARVQHYEQQQWENEAEDVIQNVKVDEPVHPGTAQDRLDEVDGTGSVVVFYAQVAFEVARKVVEAGEGNDGYYTFLSIQHGDQCGGSVRQAQGDVTTAKTKQLVQR